jgi:hypothetical protein
MGRPSLDEIFSGAPARPPLDEIFNQGTERQEPAADAKPASQKISLSQMLLPATNEYAAAHGNDPSFGRYGAMAKDVVSLPKRLLDAYAAEGTGNPDQVIEAATRTKPQGISDAIAREAPLMLTPQLKLAGSGAMRIMSALGSGAAEAIPSVALHQLEGKSEGQDFSLKRAAGEVAAGGTMRGGFEAAGQAVQAGVPYLKRGISKMSEVNQDALESVTNPQTGAQNLAQASGAARRFGTADGGTDLTPMAEELGQKVDAENAARKAAVDQARGAQRIGMEKDLLGLRSDRPVSNIQQIPPGQQGSQIQQSIEGAKGPMQDAWQAGDAAALGDLRTAPASTRTVQRIEEGVDKKTIGALDDRRTIKTPYSRTVTEETPVLTGRISDILTEHKALSPEQGVPKITPGAAGAIKSIMGMAQNQGKSIDDLINLKGQLRSMQGGGKFEGNIFDAGTDDRAFGQVANAIDQTIEESIQKAVPDKGAADQIVSAFRANQIKYARLKDALGDLSGSLGQVRNTENIISKVKAMGPDAAVGLIEEAKNNAPLKPVVEDLRKGFVDDLLLSSVKNGEFSPDQFAKEWSNISDDVKKAWLKPEQIQSVEKAVKAGTQEIKDPELVGQTLFGKNGDQFLAEKKLGNITSAAQKKALAELQTLDALFGTQYTQDATAAYRAKQLQIGESGKLPGVGNIRTGKAQAAAAGMGAAGASIGAGIAGPIGAGLGGAAGYGAGFFAQSPAGAVLMFRALNRLEGAGVSDATKTVLSQGLRSSIFQPQAQRINP